MKKKNKEQYSRVPWFTFLTLTLSAAIALFLLPEAKRSLAAIFDDLQNARAELASISDQKAALQVMLADQAIYEEQWRELLETTGQLQKTLPSVGEKTETLADLEKVLTSMPGEIRRLIVGPLVQAEQNCSITLQIAYCGTPGQVETFLKEIEDFSALLIIESLSYKLADRSQAELDLSLKLYFYNDEKADPVELTGLDIYHTGESGS